MSNIQQSNNFLSNKEKIFTSFDVVKETGKLHKHVMRDVRDEIKNLGKYDIEGETIFGLSYYTNSQNKNLPMYVFGIEGALQLSARYNAKLRNKLVKFYLNKIMEEKQKTELKEPEDYANQIPDDFKYETAMVLHDQHNQTIKTQLRLKDRKIKGKERTIKYISGQLEENRLLIDYDPLDKELNSSLKSMGINYPEKFIDRIYAKYENWFVPEKSKVSWDTKKHFKNVINQSIKLFKIDNVEQLLEELDSGILANMTHIRMRLEEEAREKIDFKKIWD